MMNDVKSLDRHHRKFVEGLSEGLSNPKAAVAAGYSESYGRQLARMPAIKSLLRQRLEERGLNEDKIAEKLAEGLDAMAPPRKDGGTLYPDNFVRKQYLDMLCRIRGDYAPEETVHTERKIQLVLDASMIKALKDTDFIDAEEVEILEAEIVPEDEERHTAEDSQPV